MRCWRCVVFLALTIMLVLEVSWADDPKPDAGNRSSEALFAPSRWTLTLSPDEQKDIQAEVESKFGTWAEPVFWKVWPLDIPRDGKAERRQVWRLMRARKLFSEKCTECHGRAGAGAGDGPKAKAMQPKPRDFRLAKFKWTSTTPVKKPTLYDIRETLSLGIPGTSMSAFADLTDDESQGLAEYLRWLSMRGEYEKLLAWEGITSDTLEDIREELLESWSISAEDIVRPETKQPQFSAALVQKGRDLFLLKRFGCFQCHGEIAQGDGPYTKRKFPKPDSDELNSVPGLHNYWGLLARPANLTKGIYRGVIVRETSIDGFEAASKAQCRRMVQRSSRMRKFGLWLPTVSV